MSPRRRAAADDVLELFDAEPARRRSARARPPVVSEMPAFDVELDIPGASSSTAVPVSAVAETVKAVVEGAFVPLWVRGEVSDFKAHRNGHWYFSLRDHAAQLRCVVWARDARRLPAPPDDGMQVVALGQLAVYTARTEVQLTVRALDAEGDGLWRKALERTRAVLAADGLLAPERKRALPRYPRRVAIITSPDGAALHDVAAVLHRRWPVAELIVVAAKVQGEGAAEELCAAVERVSRYRGVDVVIIGRGGGAAEDLWAFNDERLARTLAACPVPTVSAVGHEVDVTICDLVADLRAPTPSAAAEAVAPVLDDLRAELREVRDALAVAMDARRREARAALDEAAHDLRRALQTVGERHRATLATRAAQLHALSPLATLGRGFAFARASDTHAPLTSVADFAPDHEFDLLLRDGRVRARTLAVTPDPLDSPRPGS
ncbi:exodeoxyribonuclease 7 large subunit [Gemmatimonadetes bacterium T265]|nr:exodeoxyribonuclease 7 large subunit [Gemmatimonadetes bacterium T265]